MCVCVLGVFERDRDFDESEPFVFGIVAVVGGSRSGETLFSSLSMELFS